MLGVARQSSSITTHKYGAKPIVNNWNPYANNNIVVGAGPDGQQAAPGVNIFSIHPIYPKTFQSTMEEPINFGKVFKPTNVKVGKLASGFRAAQTKAQFENQVRGVGPTPPPDTGGAEEPEPKNPTNHQAPFQNLIELDDDKKPVIKEEINVKQSTAHPVTNLGFDKGVQTSSSEIKNEEEVGGLATIDNEHVKNTKGLKNLWDIVITEPVRVKYPSLDNSSFATASSRRSSTGSFHTASSNQSLRALAETYERLIGQLNHLLRMDRRSHGESASRFNDRVDMETQTIEERTGLSNAETGTDRIVTNNIETQTDPVNNSEHQRRINELEQARTSLEQRLEEVNNSRTRDRSEFERQTEALTERFREEAARLQQEIERARVEGTQDQMEATLRLQQQFDRDLTSYTNMLRDQFDWEVRLEAGRLFSDAQLPAYTGESVTLGTQTDPPEYRGTQSIETQTEAEIRRTVRSNRAPQVGGSSSDSSIRPRPRAKPKPIVITTDTGYSASSSAGISPPGMPGPSRPTPTLNLPPTRRPPRKKGTNWSKRPNMSGPSSSSGNDARAGSDYEPPGSKKRKSRK